MNKTFGMMVTELRKARGMTQPELAQKMSVTYNTVSKWERDLSYPNTDSLPKLAEILGVSVDELMQAKMKATASKKSVSEIVDVIFKAVAVGMGVAVTVLTILDGLDVKAGMTMLGIGLTCASISGLKSINQERHDT